MGERGDAVFVRIIDVQDDKWPFVVVISRRGIGLSRNSNRILSVGFRVTDLWTRAAIFEVILDGRCADLVRTINWLLLGNLKHDRVGLGRSV